MTPRRAARNVLALAVFAILPSLAAAQDFCVVPPDTAWRPVNFGYETQTLFRIDSGRVSDRSYPIVRNVSRNSAADSAGFRDGDILVAVNGFDVLKRRDSARVRGPGVPTRFALRRGDSTFERTLVGVPTPGCRSGATAAGTDYMVGVETDADGIQRVVQYRLRR
jgi:membrane-associated protease RseP (regulator of RpoE activity)